jgi:hypothetical protein
VRIAISKRQNKGLSIVFVGNPNPHTKTPIRTPPLSKKARKWLIFGFLQPFSALCGIPHNITVAVNEN